MIRRLTAISAIVLVAALVAPAAHGSSPQDVANDIAEHVMSPFCPGVTLHDCPSDNAVQLRAQIARWSAAGMTKAQIMSRLIDQYGDEIRAEPPARGTGLLAWLLPGIAVAVGLALAAGIAMRWSRRSRDRSTAPVASSPLHERVEAELMELRGRL